MKCIYAKLSANAVANFEGDTRNEGSLLSNELATLFSFLWKRVWKFHIKLFFCIRCIGIIIFLLIVQNEKKKKPNFFFYIIYVRSVTKYGTSVLIESRSWFPLFIHTANGNGLGIKEPILEEQRSNCFWIFKF